MSGHLAQSGHIGSSLRRKPQRGARSASAIVLLVGFALLAGCVASTNRLREAQDSFNRAAAAENTLKAGRLDKVDAGMPVTDMATIRSLYGSTLASLDKLEPADVAQLKKDQLWGNVETLRALAQWRLGNADAAVRTADDALRATAVEGAGSAVHPRDRAMLEAVRGLVKNDQAYSRIVAKKLDGVDALLVGPNGAMQDLIKARVTVDGGDPVQVYLLQAELAAYRNFTQYYFAANRQQAVPEDHPARKDAQAALQTLSDLLKQSRPKDSQNPSVVQYWTEICGLELPSQ